MGHLTRTGWRILTNSVISYFFFVLFLIPSAGSLLGLLSAASEGVLEGWK